MTDFELTSYKIGDLTIAEMTTATFLGIVANRMNTVDRGSPTLTELGMMLQHPPMGQMTMENKIEVIRKLEKIGIALL